MPNGTTTLVAGQQFIYLPGITLAMFEAVILDVVTPGGTTGSLQAVLFVPLTGFTIASSSFFDSSTVSWQILIEP